MNRKKTVGQISTELKENALDNTHTAEEQMREQLGKYEHDVFKAIEDSKKNFPDDFYVVALTKKERLMDNVIRIYFFGRLSCPTPEYDQAVYFYDRKLDKIEFLWVIPSKHTCEFYKEDILNVPSEERQLLKYVLDFEDGTLLKYAKIRNKEAISSNQLIV